MKTKCTEKNIKLKNRLHIDIYYQIMYININDYPKF